MLLKHIHYSMHSWNICVDLLLGLQLGYTKYCCFICEWDSHAKESHYSIQSWPLRKKLVLGQKNVAHESLVDLAKIYFPPLHIKLVLIKNFVKAMNKEGKAFHHLRQLFPRTKLMVPKSKWALLLNFIHRSDNL